MPAPGKIVADNLLVSGAPAFPTPLFPRVVLDSGAQVFSPLSISVGTYTGESSRPYTTPIY